MNAIEPYLNFNGDAKEALAFYAKAFDGQVLFSQTFGQSPMADKTPDDYKEKIMHATFQAGDLKFMVSDCPPHWKVNPGDNVHLSLHFTTAEEADKRFNAVAEGGKVIMPLQETFWAERFGMVADKYGFHWMFNVEKSK